MSSLARASRILVLATLFSFAPGGEASAADTLYYVYDASGARVGTIDPATALVKAWGNIVLGPNGTVTLSSGQNVGAMSWGADGGKQVVVNFTKPFASQTSYVFTPVNLAGGAAVGWVVLPLSNSQVAFACSVPMTVGTRLGFVAIGF